MRRILFPSGSLRINRIRLEFKALANLASKAITKVLIESDWNLKLVYQSYPSRPNTGINRIRLEFKADGAGIRSSNTLPVLIESDWNLKVAKYPVS